MVAQRYHSKICTILRRKNKKTERNKKKQAMKIEKSRKIMKEYKIYKYIEKKKGKT